MILRFRIACALTCLLLLVAQPGDGAYAQDGAFAHFTMADGLSHHTVFAGLQDRQGFLWFGTLDGLNRCDGYTCTVFAHDPRDTSSLSNSWVWALFEDRDGVLWVGTWGGGLNRFDRATETFTRYQHDPQDPRSLSNDIVESIWQDHAGVLWVGTSHGGLNRFDRATETFTRYQHDPQDPRSLSSNSVHTVYEDSQQQLWVGTQGGGLNRFDPATESFIRFTARPNDPGSVKSVNVEALHEDRAGQFWVGTWDGGLHRMDRTTDTFDQVAAQALGRATIRVLYTDRRGDLWVGTFDDGLFRIAGDTGVVSHFLHETDNPHSLSDNSITALFEDHTGMLWIGTRGGVDRVNVQQMGPTQYSRIPGRANSLRDTRVTALAPDGEDGLWVGTHTGLDRLDLATGTFAHYRFDPGQPQLRANAPVHSFLTTNDRAVWVGTDGSGLGRLDPATNAFTYFIPSSSDTTTLSNTGVFSLVQLRQRPQELWTGTWVGLNRMDVRTGRFTKYRSGSHGLSDDSILALYEAPSEPGTLWIGTNEGGLNRFDMASETVAVFRHLPEDTTSLSSNHVLSLHEDWDGTLWVGTSSGLNRMIDRRRFRVYTTDDGLPNNTVHCIIPDDHEGLWLGTNRGVARFDLRTDHFERFDRGDGLPEGALARHACVRLGDGRLAFGGEEGLFLFHPDSLRGNPYPPRVALTAFHLFGQPVGFDDDGRIASGPRGGRRLSAGETITLHHDENVFSISYAALHFANPARNRYAYRMEGLRDSWVEAGTQRTASFTGLGPGSYVFQVKASNSDGVWNEGGVSVRVRILPPWWRTGWAYAGYGLLVLALVVGFVQIRSFQLRRRNWDLSRLVEARTAKVEAQKLQLQAQADKLLELDRAKSRFFANLSHEFRTPLTLIQSPVESALRGDYGPLDALLRDHLDIAGRNTERLRRLIDQLLDLTKLEAGAMTLRASRQDVMVFLRRIMGNFASLSQRKMITLDLESDANTLDLYFDADKLEQVMVNLLANAFKFTSEGGRIAVRLRQQAAEHATIQVTDTGTGIPTEVLPHLFDRFFQHTNAATPHEGTGIGLALVKELVELHGGTVSVESQLGQGTTFSFTLPVGRAHLRDKDVVLLGPASSTNDMAGTISSPAASAPPADAPMVLVVEDNEDLRAYLMHHLGKLYRILEAKDGAEGYQRACETPPDLVISDVMMPQMDGLELLRRLKAHGDLQTVPVILLTARTEAQDRLAGFEAEADAYVAKPFHLPELYARITALLDTRARLQRAYGQQVVHLAPDDPQLPPDDARFLAQVEAAIAARLGESDFGVEALAEDVFVSRSQVYRRLKELTGESPAALMRRMRLERARQLIDSGVYSTMAEVAAAVGFSNASYFARLYRQHEGDPADA